MPESNSDQWFDSVATKHKPIVHRLRQIILKTVPKAVEETKWSRPCYSFDGKLFCYLQSSKSHVTLGFQNGASLNDPHNLLEGTGKDMRHTKIRELDDIDETVLKKLLKQAASL